MDAKEAAPFDIRNGPDDDFLPPVGGGSSSDTTVSAAGLPAAFAYPRGAWAAVRENVLGLVVGLATPAGRVLSRLGARRSSRAATALRSAGGRAPGHQFEAPPAGRRSAGPLATTLAAACLVLPLTAFLAAPAQSQTVYVSNLQQASSGTINGSSGVAQTFTTGSATSDYALGSVDFTFGGLGSVTLSDLSAAIYTTTGNDNEPDTKLYDLTNPTTLEATAVNRFTAPAGATLTPGTFYAVVILTSGIAMAYNRTSFDEEDTAETGWAIEHQYFSNSNSWNIRNNRSFKIAVNGPSNTSGICGRTLAVQTAILGKISGVSACADVTTAHLAAITGTLDLASKSISALAEGDFAGLTALTTLNLTSNDLTGLPAGVFDPLTELTTLNLSNNDLASLRAGVFDPLTELTSLNLILNDLTELPAGVFDKLTKLTTLDLSNNELSSLRAGVFDELTMLQALTLGSNQLSALPDRVFEKLTALTTILDLSDNPGSDDFVPTAMAAATPATIPPAGGAVVLDAAGSGGAWGTNVTYAWALTDPLTGVTVTYDPDAASAMTTATVPGSLTDGSTLTFTLTVTGIGFPTPETDTVEVGVVDAPTDATLSDLALENADDDSTIALNETFATGTKSYTASVANGVDEITVLPETTDDGATVEYLDGSDATITDSDTTKDDQQVELEVGANTIKVKVTAEDDATTATYTVVVTRAEEDATAPSPESAEVVVTGTSVTVTFNEDLDIAAEFLPAAVVDAFTVTADGVALDIDRISSPATNALLITLPTGTTIDESQTVKLSYDKTVTGADALEDAADNEVASFTDFAVTNNSNVAPNNPPVFPSSTAARNVAENSPAGTDVGNAVTANDDDNDTLTYTLEGIDAASFDLVTISGSAQIRTKSGVTYDHETKSSYAVTVKADDSNGGSDTIAVTITVTDVNEAPARPAFPSVASVANSTTSLAVTWTAPSNTGPPISNYDLRYRQGTSGGWTNGPQNVTGTSATISSLSANTLYQVQVRATNNEGDSLWSPSGSGRTNMAGNTAPTFPSSTATRNVAENSPAGTNVGNAVTATDDDNDPLTYTIEGTDAASFTIVTTAGSAQIRTRSGVPYDREAQPSYTVIVKADDGNGGSDTVTVTINLTDVDEPPLAPAAPTVTATPNTTDSLSVSWRAPSDAGRPAIDSYDLQYRESATGNWTDGPQNVSGTSATIPGLSADPAAYQVQVRATNDEGTGDWSPPGRIRTTPPPPAVGPPSPPRNLTAMAGDQAVALSWSRPVDDGGARIVRYEYRQQEGDGPVGEWQIIWEDPPPTNHTVTGLMNGVSYTFQVRAVNNRHASPPSESASTTPEPELAPFEVAIVGVPEVAVAGASYELTAQSDAEEALVYAWRVAYGEGGSVEPTDTQTVVWTAPSGVNVAWIRVDATRAEDGATAGQSAYVRVEVPDPDSDPDPEPEPVPALPLLGQLLLASLLLGAGRFVIGYRRPQR